MKPILATIALLLVAGCASERCWHVNTDPSDTAQYRYGDSGGCAVFLWDDGEWNTEIIPSGSNTSLGKQFKTQLEAMHYVERMCPK